MPWSYDAQLSTDKDRVRFMLQDTNQSKPLFQDEEIDWVLSTEANVYMAAAMLCDILVSRSGGGSGIKSKKISDMAITYDATLYVRLGGQFRARGSGHQVPYAGGISIGDKRIQETDTDAVQPKIRKGLDNNPAAPAPAIPSANPLTSI